MRDYYQKIASTVFSNVQPAGTWQYLEDGFEKGLIPTNGDRDRLTTSLDPNALLYWLSGTWKSVEPKYHPERLLEHQIKNNESLFMDIINHYQKRVEDIYPNISFEKYRNEISVAISHSILDYSFVKAMTDSRRILDYSAGYGRNLPLFSRNPNYLYVAAEAIPATMASFAVFNDGAFRNRLLQPITDGDVSGGTEPMYTTVDNLDRLSAGVFCCGMLVWCFSEMDESSASSAIDRLRKLIRPYGYIYVRDLPEPISHNIDLEPALLERGFRLEYTCNDNRTFGRLSLYKCDGSYRHT